MSGLAEFFTADHRACDQSWAAVEAAAEAGNLSEVNTLFKRFDGSMRRHLAWEEEVVFPAFEKTTGMMGGPTVVMRAEHTQMRSMLDEMALALVAGDVDLLVDHGDTLLMLIQQHNRKEEQILYPMAGNVLEAQWAELHSKLH